MVTFKPADLSGAQDAQYLLELGKQHKTLLDMPVNEFISTGKFHAARGDYVYSIIQAHHMACRERLRKILPSVSITSSIPISNSFLVVASKDDLKALETAEDILEVHGNDGFHIDLPMARRRRTASELDGESTVPGRLVALASGAAKKRNNNVQWNLRRIGADRVWTLPQARSRGEGIVYAIADTGCSYTHPNIRNNYMGLRDNGTYDHNYAWYDGVRHQYTDEGVDRCGIASPVPCDDQGHGTHVASTAVGADGYGVAPGAKWMACRNMDRGVGSPETYLNCLNFFLAPHDLKGNNPRPELRPHVVGNSYGCPDSEGCSKNAMKSAMEALRAAGVFMSVSAGNSGPECGTIDNPPALEKSVIAVGATDSNDNLAAFSSRGPCKVGDEVYRKPDLVAPGVGITAAYPGDTFKALSGTSMASPHVGGAAALIIALCPKASRNVDLVQHLLQSSARHLLPPPWERLCGSDKPGSIPNNFFGWGRIDVYEAVQKCLAITSPSSAAFRPSVPVHHSLFPRNNDEN